jgi:hypothetical protein
VIAGRISRGPRGISITLSLYSGAEGLPVGTETLQDYSGFEVADLKMQLQILVDRLVQHIPYRTVILSRKGTLVTVGIGLSAGVRVGSELTAIQVIKINRHPTFHFIVGTDNLTLGQLKIEKVEDELSFASIISERTPGAVAPGTKISWDQFVQYPEIAKTSDGKLIVDPNADVNSKAFGEHPKEWTPSSPPAFGAAGLLFGLGQYSVNNSQITGAVSGGSSIVPSVHATGEMWLSPNWFLSGRLDTYVFSVNNGLSGSSPSTLSFSENRYALSGGYNFLLNDDFYGPKVRLSLGYAVASVYAGGSTPTAFESTNYGGMDLGIAFEFPLAIESWSSPLMLGGRMNYFVNPSLSESPATSGNSSTSQMASFAGYGSHRISEHVNIVGELAFDSMSSNFSGTGTNATPSTAVTQTMVTISVGGEYLF